MSSVMLAAPPGDGISALRFAPSKNELLLVSSWDSTTRLYDVVQNIPKFTYNFDFATLSCCFDPTSTLGFTGGLDDNIHTLDLSRGTKTTLGSHKDAISCLHYSDYSNSLFSGSWDKSISSWDVRSSSICQNIPTTGKVYSISGHQNRLVVATSTRDILIFDIRYLSNAEQIRESPLRHQTRKVACDVVTGNGFAIGSTEGRVAVEYYDASDECRAKQYAFKCHRKDDKAYPVNAIDYHPIYGSFATGGCDGLVNIWDGLNRKRLTQLAPYNTSIAALSFSQDGSMLAVAASYTYEEGEKTTNVIPDNIYIEYITENDVKPRVKTIENLYAS